MLDIGINSFISCSTPPVPYGSCFMIMFIHYCVHIPNYKLYIHTALLLDSDTLMPTHVIKEDLLYSHRNSGRHVGVIYPMSCQVDDHEVTLCGGEGDTNVVILKTDKKKLNEKFVPVTSVFLGSNKKTFTEQRTKLVITDNGIGDVVCASYALWPYSEDKDVILYAAKHNDWLEAIGMRSIDVKKYDFNYRNDKYKTQFLDISNGADYNTKIKHNKNFKEAYSAKLGVLPIRPKVHADRTIPGDYAVVAPFAAYKCREWGEGKYLELCKILKGRYGRVIVLSADERVRKFSEYSVMNWASPKEVMSAIAHCRVFVGNDSGMAHVAGLFDIGSFVIMTQLDPASVYSHTPITPIVPDYGCTGCRFMKSKGFSRPCSVTCTAMDRIAVGMVADIMA
jgi:hypothetical protein